MQRVCMYAATPAFPAPGRMHEKRKSNLGSKSSTVLKGAVAKPTKSKSLPASLVSVRCSFELCLDAHG